MVKKNFFDQKNTILDFFLKNKILSREVKMNSDNKNKTLFRDQHIRITYKKQSCIIAIT